MNTRIQQEQAVREKIYNHKLRFLWFLLFKFESSARSTPAPRTER